MLAEVVELPRREGRPEGRYAGSRTAALQQPYTDDSNNKGLPQFDQETLNKLADERVAAGFQLGFHAIGDEGVQMALDAFAEAPEGE